MMKRYDHPELIERLTADYLTGGMNPAARRRFETLMQDRPAVLLAMQRWRRKLDDGLLGENAPAGVWTAVQQRLAGAASTATASAPAPRGWAKRTWQGLALGMGVLAASLLMSLVAVLQEPGPPPPAAAQMAALLQGPDGHAAVITVHQDQLVLTAVGAVAVPSGKSYELWMLPEHGKPQAVGVVHLRTAETLRLPVPALEALTQAKGFAISVEPAGGSPTGQPTGPITYQGKVVAMSNYQPPQPQILRGQGGGGFYE